MKDARHEFRFFGFAGYDGTSLCGSFEGIEPEVFLSGFWVWAMAVEALVREDGSDVAIEIYSVHRRTLEQEKGCGGERKSMVT